MLPKQLINVLLHPQFDGAYTHWDRKLLRSEVHAHWLKAIADITAEAKRKNDERAAKRDEFVCTLADLQRKCSRRSNGSCLTTSPKA